MRKCLYCSKPLLERYKIKYCSNKCQGRLRYEKNLADWKKDCARGGRGVATKNIAGYLKTYLFEKYQSKCSQCGWDKIHPMTGRVPLEVDHIDGDAENNSESNLRLLCPNCHSLTPHFRNLNKGKGREWRKDRYMKIEK